MMMVTLVGFEKLFLGGTFLSGNNSLFSAVKRDTGLGSVQFRAAARSELRVESKNDNLERKSRRKKRKILHIFSSN